MGLPWRELAALVVCILAALVVYIRLRPVMLAALAELGCWPGIGYLLCLALAASVVTWTMASALLSLASDEHILTLLLKIGLHRLYNL